LDLLQATLSGQLGIGGGTPQGLLGPAHRLADQAADCPLSGISFGH
jgi:hypothetical protein